MLDRSPAFVYRLDRVERWPDAVWVAAEPRAAFVDLQAALAARWPEWPLHGGGVPFEPHITIAEVAAADVDVEAETRRVAASALPTTDVTTRLVLIVEATSGRWRHHSWLGMPR